MHKKRLIASLSLMATVMAFGAPMGMVSAESPEAAAVEFTGDEWDGHPEIVQVNKERARSRCV